MPAEQYLLQLSDGEKYPYQVKNSKRAKHLRIKLSNNGELIIVLPNQVSIKHAHSFIQSKLDWIEKHLKNIASNPKQLSKPDSLSLKLIGEEWLIQYTFEETGKVELVEKPNFILEVVGQTDDIKVIKRVLNLWCQKKARVPFVSMLESLAEKHGFHYQKLSIRSQKTRWGSCSSNKNINLNSKLLLVTDEVVRYVIIHELCHTVEMNHSHRFWSLVEDCDPNYLVHRKSLKRQGKHITI